MTNYQIDLAVMKLHLLEEKLEAVKKAERELTDLEVVAKTNDNLKKPIGETYPDGRPMRGLILTNKE
jgi:hypothetical protein